MSKQWIKGTLAYSALMAAVFIPFLVTTPFLLMDGLCLSRCGEHKLSTVWSADRQYVAEVFRRDCGVATSGNTRHVNLRESQRRFRTGVDGSIREGQVYATDAGGPIQLFWKDAKHLVVRARLDNRSKRPKTWRDVTISYDNIPVEIRHKQTGRLLRRVPTLRGMDLRGAKLTGANLSGQDMKGAKLQRADLRRADLRRACLRSANLQEADLEGARLHLADFCEAQLDGARLQDAIYDASTRWPDYFNPEEHGARREPESLGGAWK